MKMKNNVLEFPSDTAFKKWLKKNCYSKDDNFTSVWTTKNKCIGGTFVKRKNEKRTWVVVMY